MRSIASVSGRVVMGAGENLSLYFGLREGENADLEIISSAAIAWVETLRALAQAVDPSSDIRVSLVDVEQGSNVYNTVVEWFDRNVEPHLERIAKGYEKAPPRSRHLVLTLAAFSVTTAYPTYDSLFGDDFDENDRALLQKIERECRDNPAVETARQKFYRTVEREPSVTVVSIKEAPDSESIVTVSSSEFPAEGGLFAVDSDQQERVTPSVLEVVLVKPALVHTPRSWTFKPDGLPEFEAVMRDAKVLQAIQDKGFPVAFKEGVRMTIRIEAREAFIDGQWKLVRGGRSVMRVITPKLD
jgi:hypothetical protein